MSKNKTPLGTPIPLRLSNKTNKSAEAAMRASGLTRADVLRRAIDFGLPLVMKKFAHPVSENQEAAA